MIVLALSSILTDSAVALTLAAVGTLLLLRGPSLFSRKTKDLHER